MDEFTLKSASTTNTKKYNVFKLHKDDKVNWTEAKMRRENEFQPWQVKFGSGRTARRFKAIKEGGVGDNASYFIFYKPSDSSSTYEVCPIEEWYNVSATQRYKTLTAEEAEQRFEQRHKTLNLFSVMHLKKNGENGEEGSFAQDSKGSFKVSELDEWDQSGDDFGDESDGDDADGEKKKRKKKGIKKEKDDPDNAPDEGKEESDEGDFEQREVDYMSDSSSASSDVEEEKKDKNDVKGIAEEEALRDLLSTDEEEDTENPQKKGPKAGDIKTTTSSLNPDRPDTDGNGSEDSSDSDDYDVDEEKMDSLFMKKGLPTQLTMVKQEIKQEQPESTNQPSSSGSNQRQQAPSNKRKSPSDIVSSPIQPPKRPCPPESFSFPANSQEKIVEDLIRKYLGRKPMTLKNLLKDIRSKLKRLEGVTIDADNDLVQTIATIMKRLPLEKQKINEELYFSLGS